MISHYLKEFIQDNRELLQQGHVARVIYKCAENDRYEFVQMLNEANIEFDVPTAETIKQVVDECNFDIYEIETSISHRDRSFVYHMWVKHTPPELKAQENYTTNMIKNLFNKFFEKNIVVDNIDYSLYSGFGPNKKERLRIQVRDYKGQLSR